MGIKQLSVFVANRKGSLHEITNVLAKANIDLRSMSVADASDYGIVRIITKDSDYARKVLEDAGHTTNIRTVTAFAVPDRPGGLAEVLDLLELNGVNIEYLYALINRAEKAYVVMRTDNHERAEIVLKENNIELLDEEHI